MSGFTVIRNAELMGYPVVESIKSLLPLVDELIVGVGQSEDKTRLMIENIPSDKIRIIDTLWDTQKTKGGLILSEKRNEALAYCKHDWCFYLQADEVLHEEDYPLIISSLRNANSISEVEGILFQYVHFYGSFSTIATSRNWYRREVRLVRKSGGIQSHGGAQGFRVLKPNGRFLKPKVIETQARIFHYGWVKPPKMMGQKNKLISRWWHGNKLDKKFENFQYEKQYGIKLFKGTHPQVMKDLVARQDWVYNSEYGPVDWTLKDWNLFLSDVFERLTGHRIGEYKPFKVILRAGVKCLFGRALLI
jgi:glycosyltransferase involved in cell wall biosynthesis